MTRNEKKEQYILLRAEGLSYRKIAERLQISRNTCKRWEEDLAAEISRTKSERLEDVYNLYKLGREEHIKKLGETLQRIDAALEEKDLAEVPAEKLLKIKLDYEERLQALYTEPATAGNFKDYTEEELLRTVCELYEKIKAGAITREQAKTELNALETVRQAIDLNNNAF